MRRTSRAPSWPTCRRQLQWCPAPRSGRVPSPSRRKVRPVHWEKGTPLRRIRNSTERWGTCSCRRRPSRPRGSRPGKGFCASCLRGRGNRRSRRAPEREQREGLTISVSDRCAYRPTRSDEVRWEFTRCVASNERLSRLTTAPQNLHSSFYLLRFHARGRDRTVGLLRPLHVDLRAVLQRRAGAVLERRRCARRNREPVHAEPHRGARTLETTQRAFDLELAAGRVVVDLDLPRVDRGIRLAVAHDM